MLTSRSAARATRLYMVYGLAFSLFICSVVAFDFPGLYDFKPPLDSSNQHYVGHNWAVFGDASVHKKGVALTSAKDHKGIMYHASKVTMSSWQAQFSFSVHGTSQEGDHGLAFWYTATSGRTGPVFGGADKFTGLGIMFDSRDDDGNRNNPSIAAHLYDGSISFHHDDDGIGDQLAGCVADYRNRPEPITARITYKRETKQLEVFLDMANRGRFQRCLVHDNVELPKGYFFGLSGETIASDDVHMVHSFSVEDLSTGHAGDSSTDPDPSDSAASAERSPPPPPPPPTPPKAKAADTATRGDPMSKMKQQIDDSPLPDLPSDLIKHTHAQTVNHVNAHMNAVHSKMDEHAENQLTAISQSLAMVTEQLQHSTSQALEEKVSHLLQEMRKEIDSSLSIYSHHTNAAIEEMNKAISESTQTTQQLKTFTQQQFQTLLQRLDSISTAVERLSSDRSSKSSDGVTSRLNGLQGRIDSLQDSLEQSIASSGLSWVAMGLIILPSVLLGVLLVTGRSKSGPGLPGGYSGYKDHGV